MLMKIALWITGIILVIWAVTNPATAGHDVHALVTGFFTFASSAAKS